jgi:SAM-dependent methyltransferase
MATSVFDPVAYKETTREQWQEAAEAWHRWGPTLEQWLGEATQLMLDQADVGAGTRVLDVAAGAGGQAIAAARRVGPSGGVLATDISPAILACAADAVRAAGLANVETREMDGEALDFDDGTFDAVISRVGLIYFPDQQRALSEIHRVLRPGGRLSAIVYSTGERNPFFSIPVTIIRRIAGLPARNGLCGRRVRGCRGPCAERTRPLPHRSRVRPLRTRVVRRSPRHARQRHPGRTRPGVARDRGGAPAVRGQRRVRRPLRAPRRKRPRLMRYRSPAIWPARRPARARRPGRPASSR